MMKWLRYWALRLLGADVCPPNCPLCEVNQRQEAHYNACETCQGGFPCAGMTALDAEEQAAIRVVFPDLDAPTNGNRFPAIVLPPWDWSKKP